MTLDKCSHCGLCKANCPVLKVMLKETVGPRGKMILIKKEILDKIFYLCSLCKACEVECPSGVETCEEIRKQREKLVNEGRELESNKRMIENVRKYGNPFGKIEEGKVPKELYCC